MSEIHKEPLIDLAGGRIRCRRCQAMSKRSRQQCKKPASRGKRVCQIHGGLSTGPRTPQGRQRIADAKTVHGRDSRAEREQASANSASMRELEDVARVLGMLAGTRTRGRKPKDYQPIRTLDEAKLWCLLNANGLRGKVKF